MELGTRKDVRVSEADFSKKSADHVFYTYVYSSKAWMKWAFDERVSNFFDTLNASDYSLKLFLITV